MKAKNKFFTLALLAGLQLLLPGTFCLAQPPSTVRSLIIKLKPSTALARNAAEPLTALFEISGIASTAIRTAEATFTHKNLPNFKHYWTITLRENSALDSVFVRLQKNPAVDFVQRNHVYSLHQSPPDDPLFPEQWGLALVQGAGAWLQTRGAADVPVAVIDTGIEYDHPDLKDQLWVNRGEDVNGNGIVDAEDFNGVDDDENGFIDDIRGWDFTDAPTFIDGGDYAERDNDPADENGHGTAVAGIIAAKADNGIGIAGLAPGLRVMNLRAGTSSGYLEEDDVAAAIMYAVEQGARVINMSFGDLVVSPMLRDVIEYAYTRNVVMIASSGNGATNTPHFPSGFSETIAVGAIDKNSERAGFSNFGTSLDVVAPGLNVWSTARNEKYKKFSGTSAAAPFVSATAGLILSLHPEWGPAQVRSVLVESALDLGETGWDPQFGHGLIDAEQATLRDQLLIAEIISPHLEAADPGPLLAITGTVASAAIENYSLAYGLGANPVAWTEIGFFEKTQVLEDTLGLWQIEGSIDTVYTLRLRAQDRFGTIVDDYSQVYFDHTAPVISNFRTQKMLDGDHFSALISWDTDDIARGELHWRRAESVGPFNEIELNYLTRNHRYNFSELLSQGSDIVFQVKVQNAAGLVAVDDNEGLLYQLHFEPVALNSLPLSETPSTLPPGHFLPRFFDFDSDGKKEAIASVYQANNQFGPLTILERETTGFERQFQTRFSAIPRDVGDTDGDGKLEILGGFGQLSFVIESTDDPRQFNRIWADSADFWAARFTDLDDDGRFEIAGRRGHEWHLLERDDAGSFQQIAVFNNPTSGSNMTGVPHAEIGDFDNDGQNEILFGDYDGDVYIYEATGDNAFKHTWQDSLPLIDTINYLTAADFDGDGRLEFVVGSHSGDDISFEHEFDNRHWLLRLYKSRGDNAFDIIWEQRFFGYFSPKEFDTGISAADFDNDGSAELFVSLFPDLYVFSFDQIAASFKPVWHYRTSRSNTALIGNPGDGSPSVFLNTGEQMLRFSPTGEMAELPPPHALQARPQNEREIRLQWLKVATAQAYGIYRGRDQQTMLPLARTTRPAFSDTTVQTGIPWFYSITSLDTIRQKEGRRSRIIAATPGPPATLLQAQFQPPEFLTLLFNKPLGPSAINPNTWHITGHGKPASVTLGRNALEVLLALPGIKPGPHQLTTIGLLDSNGTPLDSLQNHSEFIVPEEIPSFYILSAELVQGRKILLRCNSPVDAVSASDTSLYQLSSPFRIVKSRVDAAAPKTVELLFSGTATQSPDLQLQVNGLKNIHGVELKSGIGNTIRLALKELPGDQLRIFPNPFFPALHGQLTISGIADSSSVSVLNEQGRVVRKKLQNGWDGRDSDGAFVGSGIYIIFIKTNAREFWRKVAVLH